MGLSDDVRASILIGDYIGVDAGGKLNVIGLNFTHCGLQANGASPAFYVAAIIDVPKKHLNDEFSISLELRDSTGNLFTVPGLPGQQDGLRISQLVRAVAPATNVITYFPHDMPGRAQFVVGFLNGLPLRAGESYAWTLAVDSQKRPAWQVSFHVVGPPPGPVVGGIDRPVEVPMPDL